MGGVNETSSAVNAFVRGLAAFATALDVKTLPEAALEAARLHVLDSVASIHAGAAASESAVTNGALRRLTPDGGGAAAAARWCVSSRLTECDDIDVLSCTTPGSVVIPAAFAAVALGGVTPHAFTAGIIAGYQVMTALGAAADGPSIVYGSRWPTHFGAAMTAAATTGTIIGLSEERLLHALAIAATMTTGSAGRISGNPTSRWLTLGCALQSGISAALGAQAGLLGDESVFSACLDLDAQHVALVDGTSLAIERTGLKPYHTSRQGLSATEAFLALMRDEAIDPQTIEAIVVTVPAQYRAMIDRAKRPRSKTESRGIHYQLALAAFYPDDLYDIERAQLRTEEARMVRLIDAVTVTASEAMSAVYPRIWPGAVTVKTAHGTFEREVEHPRGDRENPLGWSDVEDKWAKIFRSVPATVPIASLAASVRHGDLAGLLNGLLARG
jgi:2-methylcitrate dehydratase PrpD